MLAAAGLAVDATLGSAQFTKKADATLPIPGGTGVEGAFNIVTYSRDTTTRLDKMPRAPVVNGTTNLTEEGYLINYGTSFVMALEFTDSGPRAECLLTYSQSMDPASPHFKDQTELFSQDSWRPILFTEAELVADPGLTELTITSAP
jgi:acyl-homoserine-lactone acylase